MKSMISAVIGLVAMLLVVGCTYEYDLAENSDPFYMGENSDQKLTMLPTPTPTPDPNAVCTVNFLSPGQGASLPTNGPIDFSWAFEQAAWVTNHWFFEKYQLVITYPGGNPLAHYETQVEHKTLYMENFEPGGTYTALVSAIGSSPFHDPGSVLCSDTITFSKDLYLRQIKKDEPASQPPTPCLAGRCP